MWTANRVYAYFQGNLWRKKKINIILKLKRLSRMARRWDTEESQGVCSLFWGVLENRQEEFGILVNPEILINDASEIQKEKRSQRPKSYS